MLIPVLLLAGAIRLVGYVEIKDSPILQLHHWSEADMSVYLAWARKIREGDWLSRSDVKPYHSWQQYIARTVHDASGSTEPFDERVGRRMWSHWLGEENFYEDPFYPYFLAGVGALFGEKVGAVYLIQALLGIASVALIMCLAQLMFDSTVALLAGLIAALFGPLVFYEALLLRSVFNTFTGLLAVILATLALQTPARRMLCFWLGLVCGFSFLVQSTAFLFTMATVIMLAVRFRRDRRAAVATLWPLVLGFLIAVAPLIARNVAVGARPFGPAAIGPISFINQNAVDAEPASGGLLSRYAADIMNRTDGHFLPAVVETLKTHPGPRSWLYLWARKLVAFWRWYEIPNNANYYYFCLYARAVCAAGSTFTSIGPLAAVGLILALRRGWVCVPALVYVGTGMLTSALFLTLSRLRLPYACALIPFAAFTVVSFVRFLQARRFIPAAAALAGVAFAAVIFWKPLPATRSAIWPADYGVGNEIVLRLAEQKAAADDVAGAIRLVEGQLKTEPETLRRLEPSTGPAKIPLLDAEISGSFAPLHQLAAQLYAARQDRQRAAEEARRAQILRVVDAQWKANQRRPAP